MTNILELLKNEKVEWKKLGEVVEIVTDYVAAGSFKTIAENVKYLQKEGYAQLIRTKDIKSDFKKVDDFVYVDENAFRFLYRVNLDKECIILPNIGNCGEVYYIYPEKLPSDNNVLGPNAIYLRSKTQSNKYLYYLFHEYFFQKSLEKITSKVGQGKFNKTDLKELLIPIPSLETQEKMVEILDKFTNYVTELQSELQSRTKQYTYYRDKLLSEEYLTKVTKEMEEDRRLNIVQLEEVVTIKNGKDWKKLGQGNIPVYGSGGEMGVFVDKYSYDKPTVLIPRKGSIDNVFYLDKPFWNVDTIFHTEIDESKLIPKYFYYFIEHYDLNKLSDNSTRPSLTQSTLNKLKLILPPLSLQNKIVKVLDKFQILLSDTKGLIPEEIEQRQKQYEYYREKLLTFDVECDSTHARTHARTAVVTNNYYDILREAAKYVGIVLEDKVIEYRLGDIAEYSSSRISAEELDTFNYVGVDNLLKDKYGREDSEYVPQTGSSIRFERSNILIGNIRPYLRKIWYSDRVGGTNGDVLAISLKDKKLVDSRYLYHTLADERFFEYNIKYSKGAKMPRGDKKKIMEYKFSIPPLHVQQHVVNILDKFDTLVNDIKEGLPKEIEQRQKQYEYWREFLLNFPR